MLGQKLMEYGRQKKKTISEAHKYRCLYNFTTESNTTTSIDSAQQCFSKEYIDNFYPKFMGNYLHTSMNTSYKKTIDIVRFSYVNDSTDGLDNTGKDENGIQFYNKRTILYSSESYQTSSSSLKNYYLIIKLTEDVGLIIYHTASANNVNSAQYVRMFKVLNNQTISFYSSATLINASTANTSERNLYFACSLHAPNQIFVLVESRNYNTGVNTYAFRQLSCTTATHASSVTTCISDIRTTDSSGAAANVAFGTTSNYKFSSINFPNDLAVFARVKNNTTTLDMRTYLGDNQSNAVFIEGYSFDNNSHPVSIPVSILYCRIYKTGTWHPELTDTSEYVDRQIDSYIKGRDKNGNFIATYYIYRNISSSNNVINREILAQGKDYIIDFDSTNFKFNVIKEL